jgi:predicted MPP superfamily phosphohydrolase
MPLLSRRSFLRASGATAAAAAATGLYTWRVEPHWVEFVRRAMPIANLPAALSGKTLVQLSDIHVGPRVDDDYVAETFRSVAALQPDIVVITGDLISMSETVFAQVAEVYPHVPRGSLATLAVLGNHDYGPNWAHPEIAARVIAAVAPFGITVLRNQVHDVEGLQIIGMDDLWADAFAPESAWAKYDPRRASIALSHNPDTVDMPGWEGFRGWILSGHTHGGQCKPPFLPPPLLPVKNSRYTSGEFELTDGRRLYINRGVGHLLRVRFNVRPEVTIHDLIQA